MTLVCDLWPHEHMRVSKPSFIQIRFQLFKWGHFHIFSLSYNVISDNLWPWYMNFDCMNIWRLTYYINKPSLAQIGLQLFKWGHFHIFKKVQIYIFRLSYKFTSDDHWPWFVTFDRMNIWGFPNQVLFKSDFNFSNEAIFTFSAYLTTWPQMTSDLNIWPLTSLTNEGFHVASMIQLWLKSINACERANVNPFFRTTENNYSGRSDH